MTKSWNIRPEEDVIHPNLLDVVGKDFKYDHAKGHAEWGKNSIDAYTNEGFPDEEQVIIYQWIPGPNTGKVVKGIFRCIDFVGMTKEKIEAFKRWGDPSASKVGAKVRMTNTLGGHGNGGKFYMRQMFQEAWFITYRDGQLSVFGFNRDKKYGYDPEYMHRDATPEEALAVVNINVDELPEAIKNRFKQGDVRFTVVEGKYPATFSNKSKPAAVYERLRSHPQSRRLLKHKQAFVRLGINPIIPLKPVVIEPKEGFEDPVIYDMPSTLNINEEVVDMTVGGKYHPGNLKLYVSEAVLRGEKMVLNSIDILGAVGCIGSYHVNELGITRTNQHSEFIYGECECLALEDKEIGCVRNDRETLVKNEFSNALLIWIAGRIEDLAKQLAKAEEEETQTYNLEMSSYLNEFLNDWNSQFMNQLYNEILPNSGHGPQLAKKSSRTKGYIDPNENEQSLPTPGGEEGPGPNNGGPGNSGRGSRGSRGPGQENEKHGVEDEESKGSTKDYEDNSELENLADGEQQKKTKRPPRVLLSGRDPDPLDPESTDTLELSSRQPAVYQRHEDVDYGYYWINTKAPLAQRIISKFGVSSARWRDYLFQRHVEIIIKDSLYNFAKQEIIVTADRVDDLINQVQQRVHQQAAEQLAEFLFDDDFNMGLGA